jgi:hypothetical protein
MSGVLADAIEGRYGVVIISGTFLSVLSITMLYRQKYFFIAMFVINILTRPFEVLTDCAFDHQRHANTYDQCVVLGLNGEKEMILLYSTVTCFFVGRQYANHFSARRAAKESREQHRHALSFPPALSRTLFICPSRPLYLHRLASLFLSGRAAERRESTTHTPAPLLLLTAAFFKCGLGR